LLLDGDPRRQVRATIAWPSEVSQPLKDLLDRRPERFSGLLPTFDCLVKLFSFAECLPKTVYNARNSEVSRRSRIDLA